MINVEQTIISQYGNSATITQLIRNMNEYIDPRADIDAFYDFVWNVETARGFGLDIWGRIVVIGRELEIEVDGDYFGFQTGADDFEPFEQAPFYNGPGATQTFTLLDDAYRKLILVKALANISATNVRSLNQLLQNMFADRGRCYVNDLGGMVMRWTFEFYLEPVEVSILTKSGALPTPAGVKSYVIQIPSPSFGFSEADMEPFDEGPFLNQGQLNVI
jgi:hypothetical protein